MLKGLELKEELLSVVSQGVFRLESDFYTINTFDKNNAYAGHQVLESSNYNSIYGMNSDGLGYLAIRMNEFAGIFTDTPSQYAHNFTEADFNSHQLRKNDVLICRTNGNPDLVGKSALVARDYPYVYESHLFKIRPIQDIITSATLVVFLNSKYGKLELKKFSMQGNQSNFSLAKFKEIGIPKFNSFFNRKIEEMVFLAFEKQQESQSQYQQAEQLLLDELGLSDFVPDEQGINIKSFKDSFVATGRLDAEYYQPKYDELLTHIYQQNHDTLGKLVEIQKSIEPGSEAYQDIGIPFYRVSNLTKFGLSTPDIHLDEISYKTTVMPKKDSILLSKDGTVGIAYKLNKDLNGITSGALLHLTVTDNRVLPDYLTLILNSQVVQLQSQRDAGGSIIQHWKPSEIEQVVIPIIDMEKQHKISELITQSFYLKQQSENLLDAAKKLIEMAIEEGEDKALVWYKTAI